MPVSVSVIMPVYNAQDYLRWTLDSLCAQTLSNVEFICVNDGSSDNSQQILDEYASKDPRFKIFQKENGGIAHTRNFAMTKASGEYIYFLDNDDYIDPDTLEQMYRKAEETNCEIVMSSFDWFNADFYHTKAFPFLREAITKLSRGVFKPNEIYDIFFDLMFYPWCAFYKKELLDRYNEPFPQMLYDDNHWCSFYRLRANQITAIDRPFYHYRMHSASTTGSGKFNRAHTAIIKILSTIEEKNPKFFKDRRFATHYNRFKMWNLQEHIVQIMRNETILDALKLFRRFKNLYKSIPQEDTQKYQRNWTLFTTLPPQTIYLHKFWDYHSYELKKKFRHLTSNIKRKFNKEKE